MKQINLPRENDSIEFSFTIKGLLLLFPTSCTNSFKGL
jgi:hypothetical protein